MPWPRRPPPPSQDWWGSCSKKKANEANSLTETLNDIVRRNSSIRQSIALLDYPAYNGADGARSGRSRSRVCAMLQSRRPGGLADPTVAGVYSQGCSSAT